MTGVNLGVGLWHGQRLFSLFVGIVQGPLVGCVIVGVVPRLEHVVVYLVVLVVWCGVLGHHGRRFGSRLYGVVAFGGGSVGFDQCAQRDGHLSGFVAKLICGVVLSVGVRPGRMPAVFGLF